MRDLDFSDGFSSAEAPGVGLLLASGDQAYANDAAFVAAKGVPATEGDHYANTTLHVMRYYDGTGWISTANLDRTQTFSGQKTFSTKVLVKEGASQGIDAASAGVLELGASTASSVDIGKSGATTRIRGKGTVKEGAGAGLDAESAGVLEVGASTATSVDVGKSGTTARVRGGLSVKEGTGSNTGLDAESAGTLSIGQSTATQVNIGKAGVTTRIVGDLMVDGTTTTLNTDTLDVEDANITINNGGNDASSEGAGITVERTGTSGSLKYEDALASKFKIGALASEAQIVTVSHTQTLTGKTISGATNTITNVDGDNVVVDPSGNLGSSNVQSALVELQGDIDTNTAAIAAHLADTIDAHDASAISVVPAGNLSSTDVQSALTELQGDADTNAANLTSHAAATTGTHGVAGTIVGTSDTQVLTNKTIAVGSNTISATASHVAIFSAGNAMTSEAQLAITRGGTGQSTASAAFGALSPLSTKGDLLGFSTLNARLPVGTNGDILTADSTQTLGIKWQATAVSALGTYLSAKSSTLTPTSNSYPVFTGNTVTLTAGEWELSGWIDYFRGAASVNFQYLFVEWGDTNGNNTTATSLTNDFADTAFNSAYIDYRATTTIAIEAATVKAPTVRKTVVGNTAIYLNGVFRISGSLTNVRMVAYIYAQRIK